MHRLLLGKPIYEKYSPKKFALIGLHGSGKSTFASKLGKILNIPVHHLDRHMFEPGGKKRDKQEFIEIQKAMLEEMAWIVEGCSFSTFEMRFAKADVLIYFHFSRLVCFWRFFKRSFNYKREFGGLRAIIWELLKCAKTSVVLEKPSIFPLNVSQSKVLNASLYLQSK